MKRPRPERRDTIPDGKEMAQFVAAANPAFRELLDDLATIKSIVSQCQSGHLFSKMHGKPWTFYAVNSAMVPAPKEAGLDDNLAAPCRMRHLYVSDAPARGV